MGGCPGGGVQKIRPDPWDAVFFGGPKTEPPCRLNSFFTKLQVLRFYKRRFTCMGAQFSWFFYSLVLLVFLGDTSKLAVLLAWELHSGELNQHFKVYCDLRKCFKNLFSLASLSYGFYMTLGVFFDAFGVSVVSLACWCHPVGCLWLAWVFFCGLSLLLFRVAFGPSGLSAGSLSYFWANLEIIFACSFLVLPCLQNLGGIGVVV